MPHDRRLTALLPADLQPSTTPAPRPGDRSAPMQVTGRLKVAIDAMVWQGLTRTEAAAQAGFKLESLHSAFGKPHVRQYYTNALHVFRTSERARNIHRLTEIRDAANNMPAVQAIRALELMDEIELGGRPGAQQIPGFVIQIVGSTVGQIGQSAKSVDLSIPDGGHSLRPPLTIENEDNG